MIYLNEPGSGGATAFRLLELAGRAEVRADPHLEQHGARRQPQPWTLHEGMPVAKPEKYIVTKWYRERHFV